MPDNTNQYIYPVQKWVDNVIVALNLCPFAKKEVVNDRVHYAVIDTANVEEILLSLINECENLDQTSEISTSILILPKLTHSFEFYLDVLELAEQLLVEQHYEGIYQIASFHPKYVFEGSDENDPANYSNRSPYPLFHLLREAQLEAVLANIDDPEAIPERNIKVLRGMTCAALEATLQSCEKKDDEPMRDD